MNKEDLILAKLESLEQEIQSLKSANQPIKDLKEDLEPVLKQVVTEVIGKLDHMGDRLNLDDLSDLLTTSLTSTGNLAEAIKMLNSMLELKETAQPIIKSVMDESIHALDGVSYRFSMDDVGSLLRQTLLNIGTLAEGMKTLSAVMELKDTVGDIPKLAMDDLIVCLEDFRSRGGFEGVQTLIEITDRLVTGLAGVNLDEVKPVGGLFGMLGALGKPEVKKGLGVALELAAALGRTKG